LKNLGQQPRQYNYSPQREHSNKFDTDRLSPVRKANPNVPLENVDTKLIRSIGRESDNEYKEKENINEDRYEMPQSSSDEQTHLSRKKPKLK